MNLRDLIPKGRGEEVLAVNAAGGVYAIAVTEREVRSDS
jgi:hypothetical protein